MTNDPFYEGPDWAQLKLEPGDVRVVPGMHDVEIVKKNAEGTRSAVVPSHTLSENRDSVPVRYAGRLGEKIRVEFPVGNEGTTTWSLSDEEAKEIFPSETRT